MEARDAPASRANTISLDQASAPEADVTDPVREDCEQERDIRLHGGLEDLEAEADAGEADGDVLVRSGNRTRRPDLLLSQQQVVVDDVVVLEAGLGVPGAEPRRNPVERELASEASREHTGIVMAAEPDIAKIGACVPVARRTHGDPGGGR